MKLLKSLSFGVAVAAAFGSASAAVPVLHVAGSTAFRTATTIAIIDALCGTAPTADGIGGGSTTGSTTVFAAFDQAGKNISNSNSEIFANGTIGSGGTATVIVEATWTGSLAGVVDLAAGSSAASFLDETNASVISAVNSGNIAPGTYVGATQVASPAYHTTNNTVEMAMSDSYKSTIAAELSTATLSGTLAGTSYTGATGLAQLVNVVKGSTVIDAGTSALAGSNGRVAIVPFKWVLGASSPTYTTVTNINQQQARALIQTGAVSQGLFTGGTATGDLHNFIYLTGRNEDSGTRIGAFSESQFGVTANPIQWQIGNGSSTTSPIQKFAAGTALNTEPQLSWGNAGHSGFASGGNVAYALDYVAPSTPVSFTGKNGSNTGASYFIGYLGLTDATAAINGNSSTPGGAKELSYNGVTYSANAVENGSYTFWTYEHCYRLSSTTNTTLGNLIDAIADNVYALDADVIYSATTGVTHAYNPNDGTYLSGSAGLFDALNINRAINEGTPVTN